MTQEELFKKLIAHCKEYGFVFPSSEIYDGLAAVYDYGQNGVELKNNIKRYWWDSMVKLHENIVGIDAAIFMHPRTWEASGHVGAFNDPLIDNKDSKKRYRADVLIEDWLAKQDEKIEKEVEKARKRFGETFDEAKYRETSPRVAETAARRDEMHKRFVEAQNSGDLGELRQIIVDCEIVCPISGTRNWTEVRQFNLMFSTQMGSTAEGANTIYLRPETAQGIFVNFLNVQKTGRMKLPFGIAQIGKAFRNEIVARQFIFRMREFEQMEMQFFVRPGEEMKWWQAWKETRMAWHRALGFGDDRYRFHDHEKLAHYANAATDIEYNFPFRQPPMFTIHIQHGAYHLHLAFRINQCQQLVNIAIRIPKRKYCIAVSLCRHNLIAFHCRIFSVGILQDIRMNQQMIECRIKHSLLRIRSALYSDT